MEQELIEVSKETETKRKKREIKMEKQEKTIYDLPGVGAATAEKLIAVGFTDMMSIAVATPAELVESTGMGDALAKKMIAVARSSLEMGFESGEELLRRREKVQRIKTGSKNF